MSEERPQYTGWPMGNMVEMLRELSRHEHTDVSVAAQAAEEIEELRKEVERLTEALEVAADTFADIQLRARLAARAAVKQIREDA
jgi:hypothetical protein